MPQSPRRSQDRVRHRVGPGNHRTKITVQLEGIADEPTGAERDRILDTYFAVYPECRDHLAWTGITHFRVRPTWIRYSDFNSPQQIIEFT